MRTLVYYIAVSLDGFIADQNGDFSCFPTNPDTLSVLFDRYPETCPTQARDLFDVTAPPSRFDTVLMGRATYQPALDAGVTSPYAGLRQVVATHQPLETNDVETITDDIAAQVAELKRTPGRDIWLCGGGQLAAQLIDQIDELQLKVNPVMLGQGIPLFADPRTTSTWAHQSSEVLPGGVVLSTYHSQPSPTTPQR